MTTTQYTPRKAYYAHLDNQSGIVTQIDGRICFLADNTDVLTLITPQHIPFLAVLGEMTLTNEQRVDDLLHGGAARIACSRHMECQ